MTTERPTRRTVLGLSGTALAALAGCTGVTSTGADGSEGTTTASTTTHGEHGHDETTTEEGQGHGDDGHGSHGSGPAEHVEVAMVTREDGHHFHPHVAWVERGGTVTWKLESGVHTTTAYHPDNDTVRRVPEGAEGWDSGTVSEQGATVEHTFETEGVYDYYCVPHEGVGMLGSVIVGEPDPHDEPGLAEPQSSLPDTAAEKIRALNEMVNEKLGHTHGGETTTESGDHGDHDGHDE